MANVEPRPTFDDYAESYDALHAASIAASGESTEYFAQYKLECLLRLGLPRDQPILDYGCGIGNLTEQLVGHFRSVHAFDPSTKSLELARRRAPAVTFHEDAAALPPRHFHAVLLAGVLHHIPLGERSALLQNVRERLAPGGKVVIFEHNPANPLTRRAVSSCPFDDDAVLLWPREAKRILRSAGYSQIRRRYIVFFPRPLARLRGFEPYLGWLPLGAQWMIVASGEVG